MLSQKQLSRSMTLNTIAGSMGSMWFIVCSPQPIYNVFLTNVLGISSSQLGLLLSVTQFMAFFQLVSIFIYGSLKRRKPFVIWGHIVQRLYAFALAGVSLWAATGSGGRRPSEAFPFLFAFMTLAWISWNACSSGWWSWVADIFPDNIRGSFFGRRSAVINTVNICWFFLVTLALDYVPPGAVYWVYTGVFLAAGAVGILDLVLHMGIPDPGPSAPREKTGWADFTAPLKDRNYLTFMLAIGLSLFSINVFAPFVGPYTTSASGIGAPNTWLGISNALAQLATIAAAPLMGIMMDRFGRKPVVVLGLMSVLNWIGYFFASGSNYVFLLPAMSLFSGFLAVGFWEGNNQMMLSLTPERNRTAYVSWYLALTGMIASAGPYAGGLLYDALSPIRLSPLPGLRLEGFQIVMAVSLALCFLSGLAILRVRESRGGSLGYVMSRLANADFFRTVLNLNIISASAETERIQRALRRVDGPNSDIALAEILLRADDADPEVRTEAVRALGRIASPAALEVLLAALADPSGIRCQAALSLGKLGDPRALAELEKGLSSDSVDFQEACSRAIGEISQRNPALVGEPTKRLAMRFSGDRAEGLSAISAEASSRIGDLDAVLDIYPRYRSSSTSARRRQMAAALANLAGRPGEFYRFISGDSASRRASLEALRRKAERRARLAARKAGIPSEASADLERNLADLALALRDGEYARALISSLKANAILLDAALPTGENGPRYRRAVAVGSDRAGILALRRHLVDSLSLIAFSPHPPQGELLELDTALSLYILSYAESSEGTST